MTVLEEMGARAKAAARVLASAGRQKEVALKAAAQALLEHRAELLSANEEDCRAGAENGMGKSLLDRLRLTETRIQDMAKAVIEVAEAPDPIGRVLSGESRPNGLRIEKVTVPLGVIGIIYEARPNVTSDAAALCVKAGNAVILRGGKEAFRSNRAVVKVLREAVAASGLPADCVQLVEDTSRASSAELMGLTEYLDVLIPRGGAGLIRSVKENSRVPVIETGVGNCHVYVDAAADLDMAADIIFNAKTSRPSVCNAIETVLVHRDAAEKALPKIQARLQEKQVELRGCERALQILPDCSGLFCSLSNQAGKQAGEDAALLEQGQKTHHLQYFHGFIHFLPPGLAEQGAQCLEKPGGIILLVHLAQQRGDTGDHIQHFRRDPAQRVSPVSAAKAPQTAQSAQSAQGISCAGARAAVSRPVSPHAQGAQRPGQHGGVQSSAVVLRLRGRRCLGRGNTVASSLAAWVFSVSSQP